MRVEVWGVSLVVSTVELSSLQLLVLVEISGGEGGEFLIVYAVES